MAKPIPEKDLEVIEKIVEGQPDAVGLQFISAAINDRIPRRTLQYHLRYLVDEGRLVAEGERRGAKYRASGPAGGTEENDPAEAEAGFVPLSQKGKDIQRAVAQPLIARKIVGYDRNFLDKYRPNKSFYLSPKERKLLQSIGAVPMGPQPAGTYARQILDRLLIDLSWNSSRLEGNSYSLLDTRRLIEFGKKAEGKEKLEAQMILNHKDAIEFLVDSADEIGFNRYTVLNLHGLLAVNLLSNPRAAGRLRHIAVGISQSTFLPLEAPQVIEECFDQILHTASAIADPFEQSFFTMVHLPYLQPFEDVNKRVSRLAANIPMIKNNLIPLTFADVPRDLYTQAILGVYELNRTELLRDIYLWAYQRSAERYAAVRQIQGEPDPFRLKYRDEIKRVVSTIVQSQYDRKAAYKHLEKWAAENIPAADRLQFVEIIELELLSLHEGNFARYRIRPSEFDAWQKIWDRKL
jgi:Fic family protein